MCYIENVILELKKRYRDPYIVVTGDFNQWRVQDALLEYPDIREEDVGNTRKDKCLDRIFTNFGRSVKVAGTLPPLEVEQGEGGCMSDHRIARISANLKRNRTFRWLNYTYCYYNQESVDKFGAWLSAFDWARIYDLVGSNSKAEYYQAVVTRAMEEFFPLVTVRSCLLYTSPSPRDRQKSRMPSSA